MKKHWLNMSTHRSCSEVVVVGPALGGVVGSCSLRHRVLAARLSRRGGAASAPVAPQRTELLPQHLAAVFVVKAKPWNVVL